jgi:thiol-disulfide isomerase/thioredoxin
MSTANTQAAALRALLLASCVSLLACSPSAPPTAASAPASTAAASTAKSAVPAANNFQLTAQLPKVPDGTAVLIRMLDPAGQPDAPQLTVASGKVQHGQVQLAGHVAQPLPGVLLIGEHTVVPMVVENATFTLDNTGGGLVVRGGSLNDVVYGNLWSPDYVAAKKALVEISRTAFAGVDMTNEAATNAARKRTDPAYARLAQLENAYDASILEGDAPVLAKLFVLKENTDWKRYSQARRKAMLEEYAKALGPHPLIAQLRWVDDVQHRGEQTRAALAVGKPYRDIAATGADGKRVPLSEVLKRNKLVLLDFWASWCGPCRGEFPHLAKVYAEFHEHGFEIYAVSLDDDIADWEKALREEQKKNGVPWINLQDAGFEGKAATAYGVLSLPSNYLISSDGTIVGQGMHEWDIERVVREQVKKVERGAAKGARRG